MDVLADVELGRADQVSDVSARSQCPNRTVEASVARTAPRGVEVGPVGRVGVVVLVEDPFQALDPFGAGAEAAVVAEIAVPAEPTQD